MRNIAISFVACFVTACFEPSPAATSEGTGSTTGDEPMGSTTAPPATSANDTDTTHDTGTTETSAGTLVTSADTGSESGEHGTETGAMVGCHGTPSPCEDFGVDEYDACVNTDGCWSVSTCSGRPDVCAAAENCPGTADECIDNCEAKPGCLANNIYCPGQAPPAQPSCYQCVGTPDPCADVDDSRTCTSVGCTWGHESCEGTPVTCETYDNATGCESQPGCTWHE